MGEISIVTGTQVVSDKVYREITKNFGTEQGINKQRDAVHLITADGPAKEKLANALSNVIVDEYEKKMICKLITQNYFYFSKKEQRNIYQGALKYAQMEDSTFRDNMQYHRSRLISSQLKEYLETEDALVLDGFINFRLSDYQNELEELVQRAVDDYLVEKEYQEFIELLKNFVVVQTPKHHTIHVVATSQNYRLFDEKEQEITEECIREFTNSEKGLKLRSDDLLISSLISISPRQIVIHGSFVNPQLIQTIEQVFEKQVNYCSGCKLCEKNIILH